MQKTTTLKCIEYILDTENEDYLEFCEQNDLSPENVSNEDNQKHIYANACCAYENETGLKIEF